MSGLTIVNRDGIVLEVNGFLAKGQELVLQGNDFQEGSRGIVVALLSQKKGQTRAHIRIVSGGVSDHARALVKTSKVKTREKTRNRVDVEEQEDSQKYPIDLKNSIPASDAILEEERSLLEEESGLSKIDARSAANKISNPPIPTPSLIPLPLNVSDVLAKTIGQGDKVDRPIRRR